MSRRQQRIDLGLASPHEALSGANAEALSVAIPEAAANGEAAAIPEAAANGEAAAIPEAAADPEFLLHLSYITGPVATTPPGSPICPPAPLPRCGPRGPDPFTEERKEAHEKAAAGQLCPVNQHGCMYFSASEWRFCPMCEWETGVAMGKAAGTLVKLGVSRETFADESARGLDLALTQSEVNDILVTCRGYYKQIHAGYWETYQDEFSTAERAYFTRSQLHNLLMIYGAPCDVLTDEMWAELKGRYDGPDEDESAALRPRPPLPPLCPLLKALGFYEAAAASPRAPFQEPLPGPGASQAPLPAAEANPAPPPPFVPSFRQPVQSLAEIMAQQKVGIGAGIADTPPAAAPKVVGTERRARGPPPPPDASATTVQTWMSEKMRDEEERAARRAAEMEKMDEERKAAYHKRRQKQLEEAGAPLCYNCGWFGHISRVCRNPPKPREAPAPQQRQAPAPQQREAPAPQQRQAPAPQQRQAPAPQQRQAPAPQQRQAPAPQQRQSRGGGGLTLGQFFTINGVRI